MQAMFMLLTWVAIASAKQVLLAQLLPWLAQELIAMQKAREFIQLK